MSLPNFLGIGAARSGTTWLSKQLMGHPQIFMPPQKGLHFFNKHYEKGLNYYDSFFPSSVSGNGRYKAIGEFTPYYLYDPEAPKRICEHLPNCKFIAILRNPVDRAYSDYGLALRRGDSRSFAEYLAQEEFVLGKGFYGQQIRRYLDFFPKENFLIHIYEHTFREPKHALRLTAEFLSVDAELFEDSRLNEKVNASWRPKFPRLISSLWKIRTFMADNQLDWVKKPLSILKLSSKHLDKLGRQKDLPALDSNQKEVLMAQYKEDINLLEELLDQDLSIWSI